MSQLLPETYFTITWGLYLQHFIFFVANKLECYITLGLKVLPGTNTLADLCQFVSYEENEVL
jgi:hypothetical protein